MEQRSGGQEVHGLSPGEAMSQHVDQHATRTETEQRDRNRKESEVVIHRDREDSGERELGHEQCGRHGADARQHPSTHALRSDN